MDDIHKYELELRKYAVKKLLELDNIEVYNPNGHGAIAFRC